MVNQGAPAAGYKFNSFQEIKSHSSILFNERLAILFYILDMKAMAMNTYYDVNNIREVRGVIKQIYKNIRTLLRNNPTVRVTLNLETKDEGIYVTDVLSSVIDKKIDYCEVYGYTTKRIWMIVEDLNNLEMMIKDVLQYFHYFIRPEFRQKPDIETATEKYKEVADKRTVDELRELVGKRHKIDFNGLGSSRIELQNEIEYDKDVDDEEKQLEIDNEEKQLEVEDESENI